MVECMYVCMCTYVIGYVFCVNLFALKVQNEISRKLYRNTFVHKYVHVISICRADLFETIVVEF